MLVVNIFESRHQIGAEVSCGVIIHLSEIAPGPHGELIVKVHGVCELVVMYCTLISLSQVCSACFMDICNILSDGFLVSSFR